MGVRRLLRKNMEWTAVAVVIALSALSARAEEPSPSPTRFAGASAQGRATPSSSEAAGVAMMGPAQASIDRGLAYLVTRQQEDGSLSTGGYGRNAAVVALSGMAWLASGSTPERGPYGQQVSRATDYLLDHTTDSGFITVEDAESHGPMYGHGFATLFLAEVYGMSPRDDLRDKLQKAIELIVRTQNAEGGWRYQPRKEDADISVTICQVMALRAAAKCGAHGTEGDDRSVRRLCKAEPKRRRRFSVYAAGRAEWFSTVGSGCGCALQRWNLRRR